LDDFLALQFVMAGFIPAIHVLTTDQVKAWMAGTSPAMTEENSSINDHASHSAQSRHLPVWRELDGCGVGG
jgi:hypothetical protein